MKKKFTSILEIILIADIFQINLDVPFICFIILLILRLW